MANTKRNRKVHAAGILLSLCALGGIAAAAPNVLFAPEAVITASASYVVDGCSLNYENGTVTLEQYTGTATSLTLPYHPNYPNATYIIGASAFKNNTTLTSVTIPAKYKTINNRAFYGCTKLTSLTLNEGLETISSYSFYNTGITSLTLPKSLKVIYSYGFMNCSKLTSVSWNGTVNSYTSGDEFALTGIYASAFKNCTSLTTFPTLPYTVTYLGEEVFYNDTKLTSIDLDYVKQSYVPKNICFNCTALRTVYLPQAALKINYHAFSGAGSANSNTDHNVNIYHRSQAVAINTSNGEVKSRVECLNESGNPTYWGAAFEGAKKLTFHGWANSAMDYGYNSVYNTYAGCDSIYKLADGSSSGISSSYAYSYSNDSNKITKCFWSRSTDSPSAGWYILSKVPYALPGKINTNDVELYSAREGQLKITSIVCKNAAGTTLAANKPFSHDTAYYYEVKIQPEAHYNINLENLKYAIANGNLITVGEPDKAGVATKAYTYRDLVGISLSSASSKPVITLRCYTDLSDYQDASSDYPYGSIWSGSNSNTRPKNLYGNDTHTLYYLRKPNAYLNDTYASSGEPRVELNLEPVEDDVSKGNLFDQQKYWNAGAGNVYYALREKGSTASLNFRRTWTLEGLIPEKTYEVHFSSSSSASDEFYVYEFKAPPVLSFTSASLALNDSLNLNYKMKMTDSFKKTGAYAIFKVQTPSGAVTQNVGIPNPVDGTYIFPVKLAAKQLNDNVTLSGYSASGLQSNWVLTKKSSFVYIPERTYTYTAMKYLNAIISGNYSANDKALAQATKDYGIMAQSYFNYNVSAISNADQSTALENIGGLDATDFEPFAQITSGNKPTGFKNYGCSFVCESESILHVNFNLTNANYAIENYTCQYKKPGTNTWVTIHPTETATNKYTYDITGLKAKDLDTVHDFRVSAGGKTYYFSISAMNYFYLQRNSTDEKMLNLGKAILLYNQAANDAFES